MWLGFYSIYLGITGAPFQQVLDSKTWGGEKKKIIWKELESNPDPPPPQVTALTIRPRHVYFLLSCWSKQAPSGKRKHVFIACPQLPFPPFEERDKASDYPNYWVTVQGLSYLTWWSSLLTPSWKGIESPFIPYVLKFLSSTILLSRPIKSYAGQCDQMQQFRAIWAIFSDLLLTVGCFWGKLLILHEWSERSKLHEVKR